MTQFLRDQASDSEEVVTPLMLDGTYLSRNFATLGPLIGQPPCVWNLRRMIGGPQLGSHRMTLTVASFLPLCPPLEAERQRERKGGRESKSGSSKQPPDQRFVPGGGRSADHLFRNVVSLIGSRFPSEINSRVPDQPSNFYNRWLILCGFSFLFTQAPA